MTGSKLAAFVLLALSLGLGPHSGRSGTLETREPAPPAKEDAFASSVRPVLARNCAPCHEPGGKMYAKLPFDRADTIATHGPAVLRRLKGPDREAVEKWLAAQAPAK